MCGWVGQFGAPVEVDRLRRAAESVASRGPDDSGERVLSGPLTGAVAHRRLSIIDLSSGGAQPMHDDEHAVTLVYNGELYNSPALRKELEDLGVRFRSHSDSEVLLRGWIEWGDEVLERIEGIFSFALIDERRGRTLLARDRLGVKPLYWSRHGDVLVAGSAPRALLALRPQLRHDVDQVALAQFLTLLWIPHPRTPWRDVHKLAPATALSFDGRELRTWSYWTPPPVGAEPLSPTRLRTIIGEASDRQLLADVPVGVLLSGGLDSTMLLRLMADHYDHGELHALTAGYDAASQRLEIVPDDLTYARQVADADHRVDLVEVEITGDATDALDELDALAWHFDDPVADPAALTLAQLCRASQTKVLLSGVGGEELFAGYPRHLVLGRARKLASLPDATRVAAGAAGARSLHGGRAGPAHGLRRNLQKLGRAIGDRRPPHYWRMMSQLTFAELDALLPGVARVAHDELDALCEPLADTSMTAALAFDRNQFLPNLNLAYVDKASMATGIEVRVPLLDEAIVDDTLSVDPQTFVVGGIGKVPLRESARGLVPTVIIDRPKSGFGGPVRQWFQGPSGPALAERIDAAADQGLVARAGARRLYADASTGRQDVALAAWAMVCLGAWHDTHGRSDEERA